MAKDSIDARLRTLKASHDAMREENQRLRREVDRLFGMVNGSYADRAVLAGMLANALDELSEKGGR